MRQKTIHIKQLLVVVSSVMLLLSLSCSRRKSLSSSNNESFTTDPDLMTLGDKAGEADEVALLTVYAATSTIAPAPVRPDPDLYARRLLRQFKSEDLVVARSIGATENYRPLLGGASEDFKTPPQETYDATSLLALQKVAEEICQALVAPNSWEQPGWTTILPAHPSTQIDENLRFLAQRMLGISNSKITTEMMSMLRTAVTTSSASVTNSSYVLPCTMLALDAEALLL